MTIVINDNNMDDLLNKQYTLQSDVLASWNELNKMKLKHAALLSELNAIREEIKSASEPSLYEQMFGETYNHNCIEWED